MPKNKHATKRVLLQFATFLVAILGLAIINNESAFAAETTYYMSPFSARGAQVFRVHSTEDNSIVDSDGLCIDYQSNTPGSTTDNPFTRIKLSELGPYEKSSGEHQHFEEGTNDRAKQRLLAVLVAGKDQVFEKAKEIVDPSRMINYMRQNSDSMRAFFENTDTLDELDSATSELNLPVPYDSSMNYRDKMMSYYNEGYHNNTQWLIKAVQNAWNYQILRSKDSVTAALVWGIVGQLDINRFTSDFDADDDGPDRPSHYIFRETRLYGFHIDEPYRATQASYSSLWQIFYAPMIAWIDGFGNYFEQGYDAWVYVNEDTSLQNILGSAFRTTTGPQPPIEPADPVDPIYPPVDPETPKNPETFDYANILVIIGALSIAPIVAFAPKVLSRR